MERREFLKLLGATGITVGLERTKTGLLIPTNVEAGHVQLERPSGVPSQANVEVRTQIAEVPFSSGFLRPNEGNAWKTMGSTTEVNPSQVLRPAEGVPYVIGNASTPGRTGEVKVFVPKGSLVFTSFGHGRIELRDCGMVWDFASRGNDHEAKTWLVIPEDCACPNAEQEIVLSELRHGHNRVMAWPLGHADLLGRVRRSQTDQYIDSAESMKIAQLALRYYNRDTGEWLILESKPLEDNHINFVDGNAPRG